MSIPSGNPINPINPISGEGAQQQAFASVPTCLKELAQWVLWRRELRGDKLTKVPYNPRRPGHRASSTNPHTWATFALACRLYERGGYDGIGFVVTATDPYVGIDLDHCRDAESGQIEAWALAVVEQMHSYTEISPSHTGLRIFVQATLNSTKRRRGAIEIYDRARFLTITGLSLGTTPLEIEVRQEALDALVFAAFAEDDEAEANMHRRYQHGAPVADLDHSDHLDLDDGQILYRAQRAKDGAKFQRLWDGDTSEYGGDASRADMALIGLLAFWTGPNPARLDGLYRRSGLMREKWDEARGESTYGARTIAAVLAKPRDYYTPRSSAATTASAAQPLPGKVTPFPTERARADGGQRSDGDDEAEGQPHNGAREHLTDMGNARRFVARYGHLTRYVAVWGTWLVWDGRRWRRDETGHIMELAKDTVKAMWAEVAELGPESPVRADLIKWIFKSESAARLNALLELAKSEPEIAAHHSAFDASPWLFNCLNGTLDLKTGVLRAHAQADLLTKLAPEDFDAGAYLPLWEKFIEQVTGGDTALATFLQRAVGYTLTGDTGEEKLFFTHGPTRTGKSTFFEAIKAMMGDYAQTADFETFLARPQVGGIRNDIADLVGARMVASIEVDDGKRLAAGLVKTLTGSDTIKARHLYKEAFSFVPSFKLWLAANDAPRVDAADGAMWQRILRIPFDQPIERKNPRVKAVLRDPAKAGSAILAWAVRGCLDWQRDGLAVPESVAEATDDLRASMDPLRDFLADCCEIEADAWVRTSDLRRAYEDWCKANGERYPLSGQKFNTALSQRQCAQAVEWIGGKSTRVWRGIRLIAEV